MYRMYVTVGRLGTWVARLQVVTNVPTSQTNDSSPSRNARLSSIFHATIHAVFHAPQVHHTPHSTLYTRHSTLDTPHSPPPHTWAATGILHFPISSSFACKTGPLCKGDLVRIPHRTGCQIYTTASSKARNAAHDTYAVSRTL